MPCRRRRTSAVTAAAVATLTLGGCALYTQDEDVRPLGNVETAAPQAGGMKSAAVVTDPADLVVTGRGFTQLPRTYVSDAAVTYAVVIENTGGETASFTKVRVTFQDRGGRVVAAREDVLATVYPNDTVALGNALLGVRGVTKMHVEVLEGRSARIAGRPATLEVSDVETRKVLLGPLKTTATVTSAFPEGLWHLQPVAVYRDRHGEVLGGATGRLRFVPEKASTPVAINDATVRQLPGLASTDVYVSLTSGSFAP